METIKELFKNSPLEKRIKQFYPELSPLFVLNFILKSMPTDSFEGWFDNEKNEPFLIEYAKRGLLAMKIIPKQNGVFVYRFKMDFNLKFENE